MSGFTLHPQLAADTIFICDWVLSRVLLMNDVRFPWLVLVPRRDGIVEFCDLAVAERNLLCSDIARASTTLQSWAQSHGGCDKLNIGMIGNIVPQLHVHIVARRTRDEAWPLPVWGRGNPVRYPDNELACAADEISRLCFQ